MWEKRQPLTLRDVRYFARCYVALADMPKDEMYDLIRDNFNVDENNRSEDEMKKWKYLKGCEMDFDGHNTAVLVVKSGRTGMMHYI